MARTASDTETGTDRRRWLVPAVVVAAVVLGLALWLTKPWLLFVDVVAEESLPVTIGASAQPEGEDVPGTAAAPGGPVEAPPTDGQQAATTTGAASDTPTRDDDPMAADETDGPATPEDPTTTGPTAEPTAPVVLASGEFISRDHGTSGVAAVVRLPDGSRVLTIEDLDTDNGPDLFVYLDDDAADAPEGDFDDGISLGRLRANQGDLVYEIPDDVDLSAVASVGIWCDRFSSLFGAADLARVVPAA